MEYNYRIKCFKGKFMKFNEYQKMRLHNIHGDGEFIRVFGYNKFGTPVNIRAKIKQVYPDSLVLNYNTEFESSMSGYPEVTAVFNTTLAKERKGLFAKPQLKNGFFIEKIVTETRQDLFINDDLTMIKAKKLFEENRKKDNRAKVDISNDRQYSLYNQFIGDRVVIEKYFEDGTSASANGVLESASRYSDDYITLALAIGESVYELNIYPNVDKFFVRHANGSTSEIFSFPIEEEFLNVKTKYKKVFPREDEARIVSAKGSKKIEIEPGSEE